MSRISRRALVTVVAAASLLVPTAALSSPTSPAPEPGSAEAERLVEPTGVTEPTVLAGPQPGASSVDLELLATFDTGIFDESAAEIVEYDSVRDRLYVVNAQAGGVDVLDLADVDAGELPRVQELSAVGAVDAQGETIPEGAVINSVVSVPEYTIAAVEHPEKTENGWVVLWDGDDLGSGALTALRVGPLPDMVTVSDPRHGTCTMTCIISVANEGEPAEDFSSDPEGSVSVITLDPVAAAPTQADVRTARFTTFDEGTPLPEGVRVFGPDVEVPDGQEPAGRVARNLEPEYITVAPDGQTAFVALQEANAIATLDLEAAEFTDLWAIPLKDWSTAGEGFDASNRDDAIALGDWPVYGMAHPDGIGTYTAGGETYIVTANEGDAREWGDYNEVVRLADEDYPLCPDVFGGEEGVAELEDEAALGRLNVSIEDGLREDEGCYEQVHAFGARGISILTTDGEVAFDSASMMEDAIRDRIEAGDLPEQAWNPNHTENPSFDNRSDDKGPEPEYVEIANVGARVYAFVCMERQSGIMTFDITNPQDVRVVGYADNRAWDAEFVEEPVPDMGDLGPEGLAFFHRAAATDDRGYLAVGNEVSGTTSVYRVTDRSFDQIGGVDRYDTAAVISQVVQATGFRVSSGPALVTSGQDWPDALTAGPSAGFTAAPLLLTKKDAVPAVTALGLLLSGSGSLTVFGGTEAVAERVLVDLSLIIPAVSRIGGDDRYETAVATAPLEPTEIFLATGSDFPDALAAGPLAADPDNGILLTRPDRLPTAVAEYLQETTPARVTILGGRSAVSQDVIEAVEQDVDTVEFVEGDDRYDTAALLSERLEPGVRTVYVATGQDYPDALATAGLAGAWGNPVLLTRPDHLPARTVESITRLQPDRIVVVGGDSAVEDGVREQLAELLP